MGVVYTFFLQTYTETHINLHCLTIFFTVLLSIFVRISSFTVSISDFWAITILSFFKKQLLSSWYIVIIIQKLKIQCECKCQIVVKSENCDVKSNFYTYLQRLWNNMSRRHWGSVRVKRKLLSLRKMKPLILTEFSCRLLCIYVQLSVWRPSVHDRRPCRNRSWQTTVFPTLLNLQATQKSLDLIY